LEFEEVELGLVAQGLGRKQQQVLAACQLRCLLLTLECLSIRHAAIE
jgi:hypothetical protein